MASKQNLMGLGMPGAQANLLGVDRLHAIAAAGTGQMDAAAVDGNFVSVIGADGAGVRLPPSGDASTHALVNIEPGSSFRVYPAQGEALLPNGENLPVTLAAGHTLVAIPAFSPDAPAWAVLISA